MIILVTGGRNYSSEKAVHSELDALLPEVVVQGGCPTGADLFARNWCKKEGVQCVTFHANWSHFHGAAGPIRNSKMADFSGADLVLAFKGGRGTNDMIANAKKRGIKVDEFE